LFGIATVVAFATTLSGQNASPAGCCRPSEIKNPPAFKFLLNHLLPDQVIINVQHALKVLGYYVGDVTGSLGPASRQALSAYQRDYGFEVTGAIDEPTVHALGLI
jgi:peptidoglycan hydrolase-like protein with peptidoglycan-binding domain